MNAILPRGDLHVTTCGNAAHKPFWHHYISRGGMDRIGLLENCAVILDFLHSMLNMHTEMSITIGLTIGYLGSRKGEEYGEGNSRQGRVEQVRGRGGSCHEGGRNSL